MITVTDNWYPCFEDNQVCASLSLHKSGKEYAVLFSVFGADDFGVCMKFRSTSCEQSHYVYRSWKRFILDRIPDGVDVEWFYEHGFYCD